MTFVPQRLSSATDSTQVVPAIAYYATVAGGRVAFNITTGIVSLSGAGEQQLAAVVNPTGSGKDMYLDFGEFGSSANTTFRRYRNATITNGTNPISAANMGGGSATSVAILYTGSNYTRTGGTVAKTAHIAAYQQYLTQIQGKTILRPGNSMAWTIEGAQGGGAFTASIYFEYYELTAIA